MQERAETLVSHAGERRFADDIGAGVRVATAPARIVEFRSRMPATEREFAPGPAFAVRKASLGDREYAITLVEADVGRVRIAGIVIRLNREQQMRSGTTGDRG